MEIDADEEFNMLCIFAGFDSLTFREAYQESKWREVMQEEIHAITKNSTWELTSLS